MNSAIEAMLGKYQPKNDRERENVAKEIIQEIALAGCSRGGFFEKAAFYGGTCLRIFYGLNRFSEDLDFALIENDPEFRLSDYFPALEREFASYGIEIFVEEKKKASESGVQSAFLKSNARTLMMTFFPKSEDARKIISNQKLKIKFEVDTANPGGGRTETKFRLLPSPYEVRVFDESTLFAGKIHAILCRNYKERVKGRDYYDYLFYAGKGSSFNLCYLESKLKNTGIIAQNETLTLEMTKQMLEARFNAVDYERAKEDVLNFLSNQSEIAFWKKELFLSTLSALKAD